MTNQWAYDEDEGAECWVHAIHPWRNSDGVDRPGKFGQLSTHQREVIQS